MTEAEHSERLARIEALQNAMAQDLKEVREFMERLVKVEERMAANAETARRMGQRLEAVERRLGDLERTVSATGAAMGHWERWAWIVAGAGVGTVAYLLRGLG